MLKDNKQPLVSFIIPVYNAEKTVTKCLESLLKQSYTNIEVICVDDGSQDDSALLIQEIEDDRIVIYIKDNEGSFSTRNFGLDKAKGEFIAFIDADDYISEDYLKDNIYHMIDDDELDVVQIPFEMVDEQGKTIMAVRSCSDYYYNETEYLRAYYEGIITGFVCAKIVRREVFDKIRFPSLSCSGDSYIQPDLAHYARKTYLSVNGRYYYYQNPESISKTEYNARKTKDSLKMHCHTYNVLYNNPALRDLRLKRFFIGTNNLGYAMRKFGEDFSRPFIDFFSERKPSLSDIFISDETVIKKIKALIIVMIGVRRFFKYNNARHNICL